MTPPMQQRFWRYAAPLALWLLTVPAAHAQFLSNDSLNTIGSSAYGEQRISASLPAIIGNLVKIFIGALGVIFLLLTVYAGYLYLTAQGDEDKVKHAKETLQRGVTGLLIIMAAYAIASFVLTAVLSSTAGTPTP